MKHKRAYISPKKHRYRRISRMMLVVLILLLAVLGGIFIKQKKEDDAQKAQEAKTAAQTGSDTEPAETESSTKSAEDATQTVQEEQIPQEDANSQQEEEDAGTAGTSVNKDIQTAQNTATEENHKTNGLAICMYHYVYDKDHPPKDKLNSNFIEVHALEEELQYLTENDYYFPTWEEVQKYVEGSLLLPEKSVVLTFDDGAYSFLDLGVPLFEKYQVPVTSFLIGNIDGKKKVKKYASEYMTFQSHSYNMHRGGGNIGHGGIFPVMDHDEAVADLQKSIKIGGKNDAFAYPYGDYNDNCVQAVKDAGFKCAVTTEYGRAKPGDHPLLLPRVRMSMGQSLESFKKLVE